jgi:glycosyltransferase involved in cell wall biosynthesis
MKFLALYWGHKGGGSQYSINCIEELERLAEVHVTYTNKNHHYARFDEVKFGYKVTGFKSKLSVMRFIFTIPYHIFSLILIIKRNKIKFIYIPMTQIFSGIVVIFLKKLTDVKVIFTMHDAGTHNVTYKKIKEFLLKLDTRSADGVLFVSKHVKSQTLKKYFADIPYRIAPFGRLIDIENNITHRTLSAVPNFLFFGKIEDYKGLDLFVDALIKLANTEKVFSFTIAGAGSIEKAVKEKITLLKEKRQGMLLNGWVSDLDLDRLHKEADILVVPYKEASQSGVLASAQEYCLPFVCTPAGGLPEQALNNGGVVANSFKSEAILEAMLFLLIDENYQKKVSEINIYQNALSWTPTATAIISLATDLEAAL